MKQLCEPVKVNNNETMICKSKCAGQFQVVLNLKTFALKHNGSKSGAQVIPANICIFNVTV